MPALMTHRFFGESLLDGLDFDTEEEVRAFLLGNQGPDPLFYTLRVKGAFKAKHLGTTMHKVGVVQTFDAMRTFTRLIKADDRAIATAYLYGYLSHFMLDSKTHPFIYAQQYALCSAGVPGLDESAGSQVHGQIEADIDSMMLWRVKRVDIKYFYPATQLDASPHELDVIDRIYRYVAAGVYGVQLAPGTFPQAVRDMRFTTRLLRSPQGAKRRMIGRIERLVRKHSLAQAMSPRRDVIDICDFDNRFNDPWIDPFTGETSTASFHDLYEEAQVDAIKGIELLLADEPSEDIVGTKNFDGDLIG